MVTATWNDVVLAQSGDTITIEGNHYFPADAIAAEYFKKSSHTSTCPWKGTANYYDIEVDGQINKQAAWYYAEPKKAAEEIKGYVAFWKGVQVKEIM